MGEFSFMGRQITVNGEGAKDSPFVVTGTGYNPALAASIENHIVGLCFRDKEWFLKGTRLEIGSSGEQLAILTIRFFADDEELLQTEMCFDVSEAFTQGK